MASNRLMIIQRRHTFYGARHSHPTYHMLNLQPVCAISVCCLTPTCRWRLTSTSWPPAATAVYVASRAVSTCTRLSAVTVVNSLIVTRLDYCNSLLAGCNKQLIDKLQRVLNCAAQAASYIRRKLSRPYNSAASWQSPLAESESGSLSSMGGATIGTGGHIPLPCKGGGQSGSKYIVDILYTCNKKYILHVYSIIMSLWQVSVSPQ